MLALIILGMWSTWGFNLSSTQLNEFYALESFYRVLFALTYMTFAAGLVIKIWKDHEINYIHIMEIDFKDRMSSFQLW